MYSAVNDMRPATADHIPWPVRGTLVIGGFGVVLLAWLLMRPGGQGVFLAVDNVAQFAGPLAVVLFCFAGRWGGDLPALRSSQRWVPYLLGLGTISFALGQVAYTIYEQILHIATVPFPSWADAVYLWTYPFMLLAILLLPGRHLVRAERLRILLDGIMMMTAVITFSWYFILGPMIQQGNSSFLASAVGLAYPLGDLVLIACLLILWSRIDEPSLQRAVIVLSFALAIIVVTDSIYDYQTLHGGYNTGGLLDIGWPLGYMFVALSGYMFRRIRLKHIQTNAASLHVLKSPGLISSLLPSALIPSVGVLLLYTRFASKGQYDTGVSIGAVILIAVVVLRQVLTILENRRLYQRLDKAYAVQGQALAQSEQQMRTVVGNAPIILWAVDREGLCTLYEGQALANLGQVAGQYVGQSLFEACRAQPQLVDAMHRALAGETSTLVVSTHDLVYETCWTPVTGSDGVITGAIGVSHDITQRTRAEEALQHQAFHDALTGLPNRTLFLDRLEHSLARALRHGTTVGVLFLDLDRFKLVNDSLGHGAGDRLLVTVAERLKSCIRTEDTVARFGGDEFAILISDMVDIGYTLSVAERIIAALDKPCELDGHTVITATSLGIVTSTPNHSGPDMLRDADVALYRAKSKGRGRFEVFDDTMNEQALQRLEMEADLRSALERGEFLVYYQPKIDLKTGVVDGMEALVRWHHPQRGLISPAAFIPLAEETGLIRPLGQWVLEEACRQTKLWHDQMPELALVTSVNLSSRQFQQMGLVDDVAHALQSSGVDPRHIQLEITESAAMEDAEATIVTLQQLKALGVQLAIDDFGTGYSSLAYLKRFPVDVLKIDRAFVTGLTQNSEDASIVNAVTSLGHALNLSIVAEGIETADESKQVHALGCEVGQGYYFAKPLSASDASGFIVESRKENAA